MNYKLINRNSEESIIVQHLESGDYDFSEYETVEKAALAALEEFWDESYGVSKEDALSACVERIRIYTPQEALEAASQNYAWPINLGIVEEIS